MIRPGHRALIIALAALVSACKPTEPQGQVIAIVDGTEITLAEFNEEARARGLAVARDQSLRDALLQELVERKLLVRQARERKLDQTPQYLLATRRLTEIALAQQLVSDTASAGRVVGEEDVRRYIADTPQAFEKRALVTVDQLVPATAPSAEVISALRRARSVDEMASLLGREGIAFSRNKATVDSATLSGKTAAQLLGLKAGQTFVVEENGGTQIGQVVAVVAQPVPTEQRAAIAREALGRRGGEQALARLVASLRPAAHIQYQGGFAPAAAKPPER